MKTVLWLIGCVLASIHFAEVPPNAAELVHLTEDIIVTAGPTDTRAAKQATSTIPIVMKAELLVETGRV